MKAALLMLAACAATPKPVPPAPPTVPVTPTVNDGLAVAEVVQRFDECSGLGGEHYVLRLDDGRLVHAGGHGALLHLIPPGGRAFVIAEFDLEPALIGLGGGWCLDAFPTTVGQARRIIPVADAADGRERLLRIRRAGGLPPDPLEWPRVSRVLREPRLVPPKDCVRAICR